MTSPERLSVDLGDRAYDIVVGADLIANAGALLKSILKRPRVVVVSDETVAGHWLAPLERSLDEAGIQHEAIVLPPGEGTKNLTQLGALVGDLLDRRVDRRTTLVALGGGVIGDITGFAAAITLRGLDFVQIPTTLLAQVDSSVGGKTGINAPQGKNLIGAFHQPQLVIADISALDTLSPRELRAGYAEVVKYGVIDDAPFFDMLEQQGARLLEGDGDVRRDAVVRSCQNKARVVAEDEREAGKRALLNLGHTFGHALERETGFSDKLLHGEGVAIGMIMALDLSVAMGLCPVGDRDRVRHHLAGSGLPTGLGDVSGTDWATDRLLDHMTLDKKVEDGRITFILAEGIGRSYIARDVDIALVRDMLNEHLSRVA